MARLPTVETFDPRPTPRSQRGVVPVRAGAPQRAVADAAGDVARITTAFAEKFEREDAEREARDLDTEYSNRLRVLQLGDGSDENLGFLNLRGQAAIDGREAHIAALEELQKTMLDRASSGRVGNLVSRAFSNRLGTALNRSATHFGTQRDVANKASFEAHQAATADDAAVLGASGDTEGVLELATLAGAQAAAFAKQTGADPDFATDAAITSILISEIERRAIDDPASAREFFEEHRGDIDGRQHNAIEIALDRAERQALRDLDKTDAAAEKALREAQDVRAAELTDDIIEGRGSDAVLDAELASRGIRGGQFIAVRKLLKAQEEDDAIEDDPGVVLALNLELDQGVLTVEAIRGDFADKLITKATMDAFVRRVEAGPQDVNIKRQRQFLVGNVGGIKGPLAILDAQASRRVNDALDLFDSRTSGPNAEDPRAVRLDIETRAASVRNASSFFRPRFLVSPDGRNEGMDALATRKATAKALRNRDITPDQAAQEVQLIKDIEAARQRQ